MEACVRALRSCCTPAEQQQPKVSFPNRASPSRDDDQLTSFASARRTGQSAPNVAPPPATATSRPQVAPRAQPAAADSNVTAVTMATRSPDIASHAPADQSTPCQQAPCALHVAVWNNDLPQLRGLLDGIPPEAHDELDPQRSTPLFLAIRLRHLEAARLLVGAGADSRSRDEVSGSMAMLEAAQLKGSVADKLLEEMQRSLRKRVFDRWIARWPALEVALHDVPDFELTLRWELTSWLPLLGRLLPSDTIVIRKRGGLFRTDCKRCSF